MKIKTAEYVDYEDIEKRICEIMGIDQEYFRDYHYVINSDKYLDLWHVWLWFVDNELDNGHMSDYFLDNSNLIENSDFKQRFLNENKNWKWKEIEPFFKAIDQVNKELREKTKSDVLYILYEW